MTKTSNSSQGHDKRKLEQNGDGPLQNYRKVFDERVIITSKTDVFGQAIATLQRMNRRNEYIVLYHRKVQ